MEAAVGPLLDHTAELSNDLGWSGVEQEAVRT
jgi:hypothetical protein